MPAEQPQPDPSRWLLRQQRLRDWQAANPSRRLQNMGYQLPAAAPNSVGPVATAASQQTSLTPLGAFNGAIPTATQPPPRPNAPFKP